MRRGHWIGMLFPLFGAWSATAADAPKTMRLATLEWLPYVSTALEHGGLSSAVLTAAAGQFGYRVTIDYFPWNRAMQLGSKDARYTGYFPAYYTDERARQCYFSAPIGHSTIGLAYLKSAPLQWRTLPDLSNFKIGVVAGYSNGAEFDALAKQGRLDIDASPSDTLNMRKLLAKRIDVVVIDKLALRYLLLTDPSLSKGRYEVVFHERTLAEIPLHVCFQRTPEGLGLQKSLDKALQSLPLRKIESEYFQRLERKAQPSSSNGAPRALR